jgi:Lipocalin-like domain
MSSYPTRLIARQPKRGIGDIDWLPPARITSAKLHPLTTRRTYEIHRFSFITALVLIFGGILSSEEAAAQTAKALLGTWTLISITIDQDGKKIDFYGPIHQGQETYDSNGRVSVIISRSDLPKFASNNRQSGTPEENKAVVQGSFAYFGTYSVSETDKTITTHILAVPSRIGMGSIENYLSISLGTNSTSRLLSHPPVRGPINRSGSASSKGKIKRLLS